MSARRTPRQARSRATVDRIVDAAARVLADQGYAEATTNEIARRAGVSPGTLYQYFSDHDAIVEALTQRLIRDFESALTPVLRSAGSREPEDFSRELIEAVLDALERHGDVLRAIVDRVPGAEQAGHLAAIRTRLADAIHYSGMAGAGGPSAQARIWFVLELSEHLTVRYVLDRPSFDRETFVQTLLAVLEPITPERGAAAGR